MSFCNVDEETKKHLLKLIDWLYQEVISSGGDGDALWYSEFYDIRDILPLVEEYNANLKFKWKIVFDEERQLISWSNKQEALLITNDKKIYETAPDWQQCIVVN